MARHPTPIADELSAMGASMLAYAGSNRLLAGVELQRKAERLQALARVAAPIERFHAELVAEAAEQELALLHWDCHRRHC